jgi:RNA recognition motif-containing protein
VFFVTDEMHVQPSTNVPVVLGEATDEIAPGAGDLDENGMTAEERKSIELAYRKRHRTILDFAWKPPSIEEAKLNADCVHPRDPYKNKFDFWHTSTGRHCFLFNELREQFDLWNEGEDSAFAAFGPGISNYFKFLKWTFWVFFLLSVVAIPCLVLNVSGDSQVTGLSSIARTTIGNLAVRSAGSVIYDNATASYQYNTTFNNLIVTEVNIRLPGCTDYGQGTKANCYLDAESLALFYAVIDIVVTAIILVAYVWLSLFESAEEQSLTSNKYLVSDYTVMVTGISPDTSEQAIRDHFNKLVSNCKLNVVADVVFAYNNRKEIVLFKERGDLVRKKKHLTFEYQRKFTQLNAKHAQRRLEEEQNQQQATLSLKSNKLPKSKGKKKLQPSQVVPPPQFLSTPVLTEEEMEKQKEDLFKEFRIKVFHIDKQLNFVNERLNALAEFETAAHPIAAFVTFHYITYQQLALNKYRYFTIKSLLREESELLLDGKKIGVKAAPEPSVIIWENLEFSWWDRFIRRAFSFFVSLLFIVITIVMIFASKYVEQKSLSNGGNTLDLCPTNFYTYPDVEQLQIVTTYPNLLYCYCDDLETSASDSTCRNYYVHLGQAQVLTYFASFVVIVVNNLIERAMYSAAKFELHQSLDGLSMSIFMRLFVLKFINTAAVFFINSNQAILETVFGLQSEGASSVEFGSTWYNTVAVTIVLVQLGDIFNAHSRTLYQYFWLQQRKQAFQRIAAKHQQEPSKEKNTITLRSGDSADENGEVVVSNSTLLDVNIGDPSTPTSTPRLPRSASLINLVPESQVKQFDDSLYEKALTQEELNELMVGPNFEFAFNYAQIMSTFFVCLTFSTGIPILYPIAAVNFFIFYFTEKYMFIHLYKIPPHFTTMVGRRATKLIPYAILMHLAMAIWMLSNNELFARTAFNNGDRGGPSEVPDSAYTILSSISFGNTIKDKLTGTATFPLFVTLLAVVFVQILYWYLHRSTSTLKKLFDVCFGTCLQQSFEQSLMTKPQLKKKQYLQCMKAGNFEGVLSYNILYNAEYKKAFETAWHYILSNGDIRVMHAMKLRAQASRVDEDYRLAEKLIRRAIVRKIESNGHSRSDHDLENSRQNAAHKPLRHLTPLNCSFYSKLAFAASDNLDDFEAAQLAAAEAVARGSSYHEPGHSSQSAELHPNGNASPYLSLWSAPSFPTLGVPGQNTRPTMNRNSGSSSLSSGGDGDGADEDVEGAMDDANAMRARSISPDHLPHQDIQHHQHHYPHHPPPHHHHNQSRSRSPQPFPSSNAPTSLQPTSVVIHQPVRLGSSSPTNHHHHHRPPHPHPHSHSHSHHNQPSSHMHIPAHMHQQLSQQQQQQQAHQQQQRIQYLMQQSVQHQQGYY